MADLNSQKTLKLIIPKTTPPMILIVGYSGSGKTTLIEKLISECHKAVWAQ